MIATSIEQSRKLVSLGLDPGTADMFWLVTSKPRLHVLTEDLSNYDRWENYPAWSLSALLKLMPEVKTEHGIMQPYLVGGSGRRFRFVCFYKITYNTNNCDEPVEAAFEMVCWLLEQGLINKGYGC